MDLQLVKNRVVGLFLMVLLLLHAFQDIALQTVRIMLSRFLTITPWVRKEIRGKGKEALCFRVCKAVKICQVNLDQ